MRGVCLNEAGQLELRGFPVPEDGAVPEGFVKVRVMRAGICATDLGYVRYGSPKLRLPVILGHELSGEVTGVGPGVTALHPGDRVAVANDYHVCGACRFCRNGASNLCLERRSIGCAEHGGFAEYIVVPGSSALPLPETLSFEEGALLEVLACCVHALCQQAQVAKRQTVLVLGPGAMGICSALTAKAMGCQVILGGLSRDEGRLAAARDMGIDCVVNLQTQDLAGAVAGATGGMGADVAVEAAGSYRAAALCAELLARRGTYVQLGLPHGPAAFDLSFLCGKELRMVGSYAKTLPSWRHAIRLVSRGEVDLRPLVPDRLYVLEDYRAAFGRAGETDDFKVMFAPQERR